MAHILLIDTNTTPFNEAFPVYPIGPDYLQGAIAQAGLGQCEILDLTRLGRAMASSDIGRRGQISIRLITEGLAFGAWDVVALSLRNIDSNYPVLEGQEALHYYLPQLLAYLDAVQLGTGSSTAVLLGCTGFSIMPESFLAGRP